MEAIKFETIESARARLDNAYPFGDEPLTPDGTIFQVEDALLVVYGQGLWTLGDHPDAPRLPRDNPAWHSTSRAIWHIEQAQKRERQREAENAKRMAVHARIAEAAGQRATLVDGHLRIDGAVCYLDIRSDNKGRLAVTIREGYGRHGSTHRYPERKDGTHDYAKIAATWMDEPPTAARRRRRLRRGARPTRRRWTWTR